MPIAKPDRRLIGDFVHFLNALGYEVSSVDEWLEDTGKNGQPDALAGKYLIEHTSIDVLPSQRERNHWFKLVVGGLSEEFDPILRDRIVVMMPYEGIRKGQDWNALNGALRNWLKECASLLAPGTHNGFLVPGLPFPVTISKGGEFQSRKLFFGRYLPEDNTFAERLRVQVLRKIDKLAWYRTETNTTVLLLESDDIALMSHGRTIEAIEKMFPIWPKDLDEAWFAHVWADDLTSYCNLKTLQIESFNPIAKTLTPKLRSGW